MLNAPVNQVQNRVVAIRDPRDLLWLHQTISPKFSSGAPNPKGGNFPGEAIGKVAADLKEKPKMALDFPPLQIFTLTDPDSEYEYSYSLSNRRLTAFKMGNVSEARIQSAEFRNVYHSLWKMTSIDGGFSQPLQTQSEKQNDAVPLEKTTLGKFRRDMESLKFVAEKYCETNGMVGEEREAYLENTLFNHAQRKFRIR